MKNIELIIERPDNESAVRLTALGFDKTIDDKFKRDAIQVLDNCDGFVSAIQNLGLVGFLGYRMFELKESSILYVSTTMIEPKQQGNGIAELLMQEAVEYEKAEYIAFRTQSARAYSAAKKLFSAIQPDLDDVSSLDEKLWQVGEELANLRSCTFPVIKGAYNSEPMYSARQSHPRYSEFYEMIDFDAGDALLCVGTVESRK